MKIRIFVANTGIIMMILLAFLSGYIKCQDIPVYGAVDDDPIYVPLREQSDLVTAFQAYCKSRDLTIEGSLTDAVTTFTTGAFNSACNEIGINISELQAEIKAEYDQSGKPIKFLYNTTGVGAMNRIFAQFLQDNELEVGDTVDKQIYNGALFIDDNGNSCTVTVLNNSADANSYYYDLVSNPTKMKYLGSSFIKPGFQDALTWALNNPNATHYVDFTYKNNNYYIDCHLPSGSSTVAVCVRAYAYGCYYSSFKYNDYDNYYDGYYKIGGFPTIFYIEGKGFCYGSVNTCYKASDNKKYYGINVRGYISSASADNTIINITTNNNVINNNNYEGDTYITNEGDVINPGGGDNPGGGGSGGGDTNIDIDFPNINFPNIPEINFQLSGLNTKFPFCIPFDMVALLQLLNAEPQAPRIQGDIPISSSITWHLDMNFEQFDWFATIMRGLEFVGFVFFLVGATINIAKG